jgi:hypothetical protein
MRRKFERQRFGSGHKACKQEYRHFPRVYDPPEAILATTPAESNLPMSRHARRLRAAIRCAALSIRAVGRGCALGMFTCIALCAAARVEAGHPGRGPRQA